MNSATGSLCDTDSDGDTVRKKKRLGSPSKDAGTDAGDVTSGFGGDDTDTKSECDITKADNSDVILGRHNNTEDRNDSGLDHVSQNSESPSTTYTSDLQDQSERSLKLSEDKNSKKHKPDDDLYMADQDNYERESGAYIDTNDKTSGDDKTSGEESDMIMVHMDETAAADASDDAAVTKDAPMEKDEQNSVCDDQYTHKIYKNNPVTDGEMNSQPSDYDNKVNNYVDLRKESGEPRSPIEADENNGVTINSNSYLETQDSSTAQHKTSSSAPGETNLDEGNEDKHADGVDLTASPANPDPNTEYKVSDEDIMTSKNVNPDEDDCISVASVIEKSYLDDHRNSRSKSPSTPSRGQAATSRSTSASGIDDIASIDRPTPLSSPSSSLRNDDKKSPNLRNGLRNVSPDDEENIVAPKSSRPSTGNNDYYSDQDISPVSKRCSVISPDHDESHSVARTSPYSDAYTRYSNSTSHEDRKSRMSSIDSRSENYQRDRDEYSDIGSDNERYGGADRDSIRSDSENSELADIRSPTPPPISDTNSKAMSMVKTPVPKSKNQIFSKTSTKHEKVGVTVNRTVVKKTIVQKKIVSNVNNKQDSFHTLLKRSPQHFPKLEKTELGNPQLTKQSTVLRSRIKDKTKEISGTQQQPLPRKQIMRTTDSNNLRKSKIQIAASLPKQSTTVKLPATKGKSLTNINQKPNANKNRSFTSQNKQPGNTTSLKMKHHLHGDGSDRNDNMNRIFTMDKKVCVDIASGVNTSHKKTGVPTQLRSDAVWKDGELYVTLRGPRRLLPALHHNDHRERIANNDNDIAEENPINLHVTYVPESDKKILGRKGESNSSPFTRRNHHPVIFTPPDHNVINNRAIGPGFNTKIPGETSPRLPFRSLASNRLPSINGDGCSSL